VFAEFERETIVERVVAGLAAAREQEIVGGTKRKLDGDQVARARATYANPPVSPATGRPMTVGEQAALFGVHRATYLRWANPHYFEGGTRDAQRFRERHPNLTEWLEKSNDRNYSRSPKRLAHNR
jgi:DNA invertase Pin-like site-specific DNA recombinase